MTAKALACIAALGLLALPLMARPGNGGRADATRTNEVYTVNTADELVDVNAAEVDDPSMNLDAATCSATDLACQRAVKDIERAVNEAANAAEAATNAAEAAIDYYSNHPVENEVGPEPRRQ